MVTTREPLPLYAFNTGDPHEAAAALLVYVVYRSRSRQFRVTPDLWERVERFARVSAKSTTRLGGFLDRFKRRMQCGGLKRWALTLAVYGPADGTLGEALAGAPQDFLTELLRTVDHQAVLRLLRQETGLIVALVQERLDREKQYHAAIEAAAVAEEPVDTAVETA